MNRPEDFHEENVEDEEPEDHYQLLGLVKMRHDDAYYSASFSI